MGEGRGEVVDEVIEKVGQDPELDEHKQRPLGRVVVLRQPNPLSVEFHCLPIP